MSCPHCDKTRAELVKYLGEAFRAAGAYYVESGDKAGWWDSGAHGTVRDFGDRLVELGLWERHPDGYGRRWFYRPLKREKKA